MVSRGGRILQGNNHLFAINRLLSEDIETTIGEGLNSSDFKRLAIGNHRSAVRRIEQARHARSSHQVGYVRVEAEVDEHNVTAVLSNDTSLEHLELDVVEVVVVSCGVTVVIQVECYREETISLSCLRRSVQLVGNFAFLGEGLPLGFELYLAPQIVIDIIARLVMCLSVSTGRLVGTIVERYAIFVTGLQRLIEAEEELAVPRISNLVNSTDYNTAAVVHTSTVNNLRVGTWY